jgi:hypothetical protein
MVAALMGTHREATPTHSRRSPAPRSSTGSWPLPYARPPVCATCSSTV